MNTENLRNICLILPCATESIKWENDLVFSVATKMFCVTSFEEPFKCSFKVADEDFEEFLSKEGFIAAPYLARAKWVLASNEAKLSGKEWAALIKNSYDLVVSKLTKMQRGLLGNI